MSYTWPKKARIMQFAHQWFLEWKLVNLKSYSISKMKTSVGDDGTMGKIPIGKIQHKRKADTVENLQGWKLNSPLWSKSLIKRTNHSPRGHRKTPDLTSCFQATWKDLDVGPFGRRPVLCILRGIKVTKQVNVKIKEKMLTKHLSNRFKVRPTFKNCQKCFKWTLTQLLFPPPPPPLNFSGYFLKQETRTAHSWLVGAILGTQAKTLG